MTTQQITIPRTSAGIKRKAIMGGILLIILAIFVTIIFNTIIGMGLRIEKLIVYILWLSLPIFWTCWVILEYKSITKTKYFLTADSLVISKQGWFGSTKKYHRFDAIKSVTTKENKLFSDTVSGSILINFTNSLDTLSLTSIVKPRKYVLEIKKRATLNKTTIKN